MIKNNIKEIAALEKRYWLKISNTCNNNCIFCHDSEHRNDSINFEPFEKIKVKIDQALNDGFSRLILSGGEATIHPDFIQIAGYAKKIGFQKIQVVTNGRMFSYKAFALKAVKAGLTEATFSIHGHTPGLHDKLSGIKGSFDQACQGIKNLIKTGRCIVNIDVVVNRLNYIHIEDIIKYFSKFRIFEYDLLCIIPFGRAFENRDDLFFGYEESSEHLKGAFSYAKKPGYYIWTNRFPPNYLEGDEGLIQDPHKLYDEVLGRPDLYEGYYRTKKFHCYPERCSDCFIEKFCIKFLYYCKTIESLENIDTIDLTCSNGDSEELTNRVASIKTLRVANSNFKHLYEKCGRIEFVYDGTDFKTIPKLSKIYIELNNIPNNFISNDIEPYKFIFNLNLEVCEFLLRNFKFVDKYSGQIEFKIPAYEILSEAIEEYKKIHEVISRFKNIKIHNCTKCLHKHCQGNDTRIFNIDIINKDLTLDLKKLVEEYILNDYYVKSLRCRDCIESENCRGMHINFIRAFGFKSLNPIKKN